MSARVPTISPSRRSSDCSENEHVAFAGKRGIREPNGTSGRHTIHLTLI
ncbi:MAG: hypothetical protein HW376_1711 [candidate division NC10 bacterium]|nr:hypothetical protein [candidate division NC10 bacterium]